MKRREELAMKRKIGQSFLWIFVLVLGTGFYGQTPAPIAGFKNFEIVESAPVETTMDNPDVRNAYGVWLEMINKAKRNLDLEQFYISSEPNEPLEDIITAVIEAGKRGVSVRIIADAGMSKTYPQTLEMLGRQKNILVRLIDYRKISDGTMHAKYFIVDGEDVYVGSQNFDWRALKHIYELGVRIIDRRAAAVFADVFEMDWTLSGSENNRIEIPRKRYPTPYVLTGGEDPLKYWPTFSPTGRIPDESLWDEKQLVNLIDSAQADVYVHVLTYSPVASKNGYYAVLDNALRRAATRGVQVHVMCADWSKRKPTIDYLKSLGVIPNIEVKLSTIPEWSGGFIPYARVDHSKFLVVDDRWSWIGTSNWEKSYFHNARNVGLVVENKSINKILKKIYLKNWNSSYSYLLKPEIEYTPPKIGE
jgi:phosphatidylserine/phosphatidylglycerophosphate/cardiolipin synthase-like enzyme